MTHKKCLVVAPHPDDELLGCGGLLLRRLNQGANIGWLVVTCISEIYGWSPERVHEREIEIQKVGNALGVDPKHLYKLGFPTTRLDTFPLGEIISRMSEVFQDFQPEEVLVPHYGDVHTDHRIVFDAASACTKWFRYPSVKRVLAYETLSETDFGLSSNSTFKPNCYVDISDRLEKKIELLKIYSSEIGEFPFPRSEKAIRALAELRGAQSGFNATEAFELLIERL